MGYAQVVIIGNLGSDPESRAMQNGDTVCSFSVAVSATKGGQETTTWYRVSAWRRQAQLCQEILHKGSKVFVAGSLTLREYTDRDGARRSSLEIDARDVQFLDPKTAGGNEVGPRSQVQAAPYEDDSEDVPF